LIELTRNSLQPILIRCERRADRTDLASALFEFAVENKPTSVARAVIPAVPPLPLGELDETSLYVIRRHSNMRQTYGEAPVAIEAAATYFRKQMRTVERALETNPSYILG
jgi:hypothetical protein